MLCTCDFVVNCNISVNLYKLHNIYFNLPINIQYSETYLSRCEQTLYNRLRIGRACLTHSYLLKDEDPQYVYLVILYLP